MSKHLQKCVDVKRLRDWVEPTARCNIDLATAWSIIRDHYCAAVVARGVCPIDCERCRGEIVDLFRLEQAANPKALLTWLAKDHSARMIEKLIAAQKAEEQFPAQESMSTQEVYNALFPEGQRDLIADLYKVFGL